MSEPGSARVPRDRGAVPGATPARGREWIFPALVAAALLVLAWMPYGIAFRKSPASDQFMGLIGRENIDDNNVYLALMRQAAEGRILFTNNFTPEPNAPVLFNFIYLVLGRLAGATGWSLDAVHRLFGGFSIVLLVFLIYALIATCIRRPWHRRLALTLACFGTGFLWAARLATRLTGRELKTVDSWLVEMSVFHTMLIYPHFVFAAAMMVGSFLLFLRAVRTGRLAAALGSGICGALLASSHSFEAVVLLPTLVTFVILEAMARGSAPRLRGWLALGLATAPPLAVLLLNRWILQRQPIWGNVVARLDFYTPGPFQLICGLGMSSVIVILTFDGFLRPGRPAGERLAKAWLLVSLFFAYVPVFNWQFHLLNGIQIPLAILATQGLRRTMFRAMLKAGRRSKAPGWSRPLLGPAGIAAASSLVIVLCCLSGVNLILSYRYEAGQVVEPTYLPKPEVAAIDWMGRELPHDAVVLSTLSTGNYIPRLAGQRVFIGEDKLTEDLNGHEADVLGFFGAEWSDEKRVDLLRRFGVDYVFYGPAEKRVGGYAIPKAPFLRRVHEEADVAVYRVVGSAATDRRAAKKIEGEGDLR